MNIILAIKRLIVYLNVHKPQLPAIKKREPHMTFEEMIEIVLKHEGGLVNHPKDPGGLTNRGITLATYQRYYPDKTAEDLRKMTKAEAIEFYHKHFYKKYNVDKLPSCIQDIYLDMCVNHGVGNASKLLQRGINGFGFSIIVDGKVGKKTIATAEAAAKKDCQELREQVNDSRQQFFNRIISNRPEMQVFARGWRNRVNSFRNAG